MVMAVAVAGDHEVAVGDRVGGVDALAGEAAVHGEAHQVAVVAASGVVAGELDGGARGVG